MKKLTIGLIGFCLIVLAPTLYYVLPRVSVVEVVGVEVKRTDVKVGTRDVYMIQSRLVDGGEVRVFRNEDAWLYFKLNSANLQANAAVFARDEQVKAVAIRHYGWRIPILSMFPNAISAWPVEPGYRHIPIFNIVVLVLLLGGVFMARRALRRLSDRFTGGRGRRAAAHDASSSLESPSSTHASARNDGHDDWLLRDEQTSGRSDKTKPGD